MASPDESPKDLRAIAARQREHLDSKYCDEAIRDDGDELSRRIAQAARSKGIDPVKYGVMVPVTSGSELVKRTKSYQEKTRLLDLVDKQIELIDFIEDDTKKMRHAGVLGLGVFVLIAISGAPLWSVMVGAVSVFLGARLLSKVAR